MNVNSESGVSGSTEADFQSSGILLAIWRDGTVYDATNVRGPLTARRAA